MKMDVLREANYTYNFEHELYFNRSAKKVFSFPFIDAHSERDLARYISEQPNDSDWKFYFNVPPSQPKKRELESLLAEDSVSISAR